MSFNKHNWSLSILLLLIAILSWPLLRGYFIIFAREWLWLLIGCVFMAIICPLYYTRSNFIWIVIYALIVMMNFIWGDSYFNTFPKVFTEFTLLVLSSAIGYYSLQSEHERDSKAIMWLVIIIISITSIATLVLDQLNPGVVRMAFSNLYRDEDMSIVYSSYRMGMTNYYLPHALPVIIPSLVLGVKNKDLGLLTRIIVVLVLLLTFVLIYISNSVTAILIAALFFIISLINIKGSIRSNVIVLLFVTVLLVPLLINVNLMISFLDFVGDSLEANTTFYQRIMDIKETLMYEETVGDLDARVNLYSMSTNEFASSFIIGSNNVLGGHSSIIDRLAAVGLVGFIPYVILIWKQLKKNYSIVPNQHKIYYIEGILAGVVMLLTKNMSNWEMWLMIFVVMPILTIQLGKKNNLRVE